MFIRLIHIDDDGWYSTCSHHNKEVWYQPGDEIDTGDFTHFEIAHTCYGDYTGCTVTRSNHRLLIEILDEEGIEDYVIKSWAYWTYSIYIPIKYLGHEVLDEIIEGLDDYPAIDDEDVSNLECELTEEYFSDLSELWDMHLVEPDKPMEEITNDLLEAHSHLQQTGSGEGLIFEIGCTPYLHEDKRAVMRKYLIEKLGYQDDEVLEC